MTEKMTLESKNDGLRLGVVITLPEKDGIPAEPQGIIQFAHGMCGCKERFLPSMEYLSGKGFVCIANDHRGHGESIREEKDRGYMYKGGYKALVDDMKTVSDYIAGRFPGKPLFLLGHSMGSLAARIYANKYGRELSGLFLCGSPDKNKFARLGMAGIGLFCSLGGGRVRMQMLQNLGSSGFNKPFRSEGPQSWTCSDPAVRKAFIEDPRCNFSFTANGLFNLLALMTYAYSKTRASNPGLPIILMNGADDPCSKGREGIEKAASRASAAGYVIIHKYVYPGMRHEILNEPGRTSVLEDIISEIEASGSFAKFKEL